jgi:hypothetical protein
MPSGDMTVISVYALVFVHYARLRDRRADIGVTRGQSLYSFSIIRSAIKTDVRLVHGDLISTPAVTLCSSEGSARLLVKI